MSDAAIIQEHGKAISDLTLNVSKLAYMFEQNEKTREKESEHLSKIAGKLDAISDKMGEVANLEKTVTKIEKDIEALQHKLGNLQNAQSALGQMKDQITKQETAVAKSLAEMEKNLTGKIAKIEGEQKVDRTKIEELEKNKDRTDGGMAAVGKIANILWAVFGPIVGGFIVWALGKYFTDTTGGGGISGY